MLSKSYELDEIDRQIIEILQKEPNLTHTLIAKKVHRSQPTVGNRIKKLEDIGVLMYNAGVSLKKTDFYCAKVEIKTKNPESVIQIINKCPHMIYALELSGQNNFEVIIISENLKDLDRIVNFHFRNDSQIRMIKMEVILDIFNDLILPINLTPNSCECIL